MQIKLQPVWQEEFIAEFGFLINDYDGVFSDLNLYIKSLLATERSKWVGEIRQHLLSKKISIDDPDRDAEDSELNTGEQITNYAIDDVLEHFSLTPPPKGETGSNE